MSKRHARRCECDSNARYVARVTYTPRPRLLCEQCAIEDRALGDVIWIRSFGPVADELRAMKRQAIAIARAEIEASS